jgi:CopG family nickel-responsive transcriptional regulator
MRPPEEKHEISLCRISISVPPDLLEEFDRLITAKNYENRSEAFRDLMRKELVEQGSRSPASNVVGAITLVYDHHVRLLSEKLTELQHQFHKYIVSTLHVHLDHDHCLEMIAVRGPAAEVRRAADMLISTKGVKHGRLTLTATANGNLRWI